MFITDQLVHCTARLECDFPNGKRGTGTAFFMNLCVKGAQHVPVLVSNRHVVAGATRGRFCLTLKKSDEDLPDVGRIHWFEVAEFGAKWIFHPRVDLAVMPLNPLLEEARNVGHMFFYAPLMPDLIPDQAVLEDLPSLVDVVLVGYPNGLWDEVNNQPLLRKGVSATHPAISYNGRPEFVIDASCFNGSSGSPVFLLELGRSISRSSGMVIGPSRAMLLGVLYAGPLHLATGEVRTVEIGKIDVALTGIPSNLGYVVAARELRLFEPILQFMVDNQRLPARNEPCPCGRNSKFKGCCGAIG